MIIRLDETDSTNEYAKRMIADGWSSDEMVTITAQYQSAGKGRRGREWVSPPGTALMFSIMFKPKLAMDKCSMVTLVAAMAIREAMKDIDVDTQIKWPNDVIVGGRKICGILTEAVVEQGYMVVGCGVNLNQEEFPEDLADKATSILIETGDCVDEDSLLDCILNHFEKYMESVDANGNLTSLVEDYNAVLVSMDSEVTVLDPKGEYKGISKGINEKGELIVEKSDGTLENVYAGEVSVRGVYGYV